MTSASDTESKAYLNWVNLKLRPANERMVDIDTGFERGVLTNLLSQQLTGKQSKFLPNPRSSFQYTQNNTGALELLRNDGCVLHGTDSSVLTSMNKQMTRGFVWQLMLHYQINKNTVGKSMAETRRDLLAFINQQLATLNEDEITRLRMMTDDPDSNGPILCHSFDHNSFKDGLVLAGLTIAINDENRRGVLKDIELSCMSEKLTPSATDGTDNRVVLNHSAMTNADKHNQIPILIEAHDIVHAFESNSVLAYVSYFEHVKSNNQDATSKIQEPEQTPVSVFIVEDDSGLPQWDEIKWLVFENEQKTIFEAKHQQDAIVDEYNSEIQELEAHSMTLQHIIEDYQVYQNKNNAFVENSKHYLLFHRLHAHKLRIDTDIINYKHGIQTVHTIQAKLIEIQLENDANIAKVEQLNIENAQNHIELAEKADEINTIRSKVNDLQDDLATIRQKLTELEEESATKNEELVQKNHKIDDLEHQNSLLRQERDSTSDQLAHTTALVLAGVKSQEKSEEQISELQDRLKSLQDELDQVKKEHNDGLERIIILENEAGTLQAQINDKNAQIAALTAPNHEQDDKIDDLLRQLDELRTKYNLLSNIHQQLKENFVSEQEKVNSLEHDKSLLETDNTNLTTENEHLNGQVTRLNDENERIQGEIVITVRKNTELEGTNTELEGKNTELQGQNTELQGKNTELQGKNTELQGKNTELEGKNSELQGQNNELQGQNTELEGKIDESHNRITELEKHLTDAQKCLEEKVNECDRDHITAIVAFKEQIEALENEKLSLLAQNNTKDDKISFLQTDNESLSADVVEKSVEIATLLAKLTSLDDHANSDLDALRRKLADSEAKLVESQTKIAQNEDKIQQLEDELTKLRQANADLTEKCTQHEELMNNQGSNTASLSEQLAALQIAHNTLNEAHDAALDEKITLSNQITALNKQSSDQDAQISSLLQQNDDQAKQIAALTEQNNEKEVKMCELAAQIQEDNAKLIENNEKIIQLNSERNNLYTTNAELESLVTQLREELSKSNEEVDKLSKSIQESQNAIDERDAKIIELMAELAKLSSKITEMSDNMDKSDQDAAKQAEIDDLVKKLQLVEQNLSQSHQVCQDKDDELEKLRQQLVALQEQLTQTLENNKMKDQQLVEQNDKLSAKEKENRTLLSQNTQDAKELTKNAQELDELRTALETANRSHKDALDAAHKDKSKEEKGKIAAEKTSAELMKKFAELDKKSKAPPVKKPDGSCGCTCCDHDELQKKDKDSTSKVDPKEVVKLKQDLDAMKKKYELSQDENRAQHEHHEEELESIKQLALSKQRENDELIRHIKRLQDKLKDQGKFDASEDDILSADQIAGVDDREDLIEQARQLLNQLKPQAGIAFSKKDPHDGGIQVTKVSINKAAYIAGIQPNETIKSVNGKEMTQQQFGEFWTNDCKTGSTLFLQVAGIEKNGKPYSRNVRMDLGSAVCPLTDIKELRRISDGVIKNGTDDKKLVHRVKKQQEDHVAAHPNGPSQDPHEDAASPSSAAIPNTPKKTSATPGTPSRSSLLPSSVASPTRASIGRTPGATGTSSNRASLGGPTSTPTRTSLNHTTQSTPNRASLGASTPSRTSAMKSPVTTKPITATTPSRLSATPSRLTSSTTIQKSPSRNSVSMPTSGLKSPTRTQVAPLPPVNSKTQGLANSNIMQQRRDENERTRRMYEDLE